MKSIQHLVIPAILSLAFVLAVSCRKEDKISKDPSLRLTFSTDTVFFDTVFTTIGSVTQRLIVYNNNKDKLRISTISLAGGQASPYRMNVDGDSSLAVGDVDLEGNDSLFIFIRVTVDPTNQNTPYVVTDSILFMVNGNLQDVDLVSWGQNARFLKRATIKGNQVWDSLQPYVVYGFAQVDTSSSLVILPGTKVYFHSGAYLSVAFDGTMTVLGNLEHPVRFQGDRLDPFYRDLPGQWTGILLESGSRNHEIQYAIIKNGVFGILIDEPGSATGPMLQLNNTRIQNTTADAIFSFGSTITSFNCVIANNGGAALWVENGGSYDFRHLTIGNYWSASVRVSPSLYLKNYSFDTTGSQSAGALTNTFFGNTVIYGSDPDELIFNVMEGVPFEVVFDHCLLRTGMTLEEPLFTDCFANEDPLFVDPKAYDLRPDSLSPLIGKGIPMGVPFDIEGVDRGATPDLGAYQWVPAR